MASRATAVGPLSACPTVRGRAVRRARADRMAGTQMAACPMGRCRMAAPRTSPRRTAPPPKAPRRMAPRRMAPRRTGVSRTAVSRTARPCLMTSRYPADSTGCRTGAGYRRARTACTGRLGPARRAGHRGGTTGRVRPPRTRTPTAGAARRRRRGQAPQGQAHHCRVHRGQAHHCRVHRGQAHHCRVHRGQAHHCRVHRGQLVAVPEGRLRVRLTGARSPTVAPGYLGYLGSLGSLGLRRCASTRPPGRALMLLTAASGWVRRWAHRRNRQGR
jgi:hypothetical protein